MALDNWRSILGKGGSLPRKDKEGYAHPVPSAQPRTQCGLLIGLCECECVSEREKVSD